MSYYESVNFNSEKLSRFKMAYEAAVKTGAEVFTFECRDYVVGYAKYLIQHLEGQGL